ERGEADAEDGGGPAQTRRQVERRAVRRRRRRGQGGHPGEEVTSCSVRFRFLGALAHPRRQRSLYFLVWVRGSRCAETASCPRPASPAVTSASSGSATATACAPPPTARPLTPPRRWARPRPRGSSRRPTRRSSTPCSWRLARPNGCAGWGWRW